MASMTKEARLAAIVEATLRAQGFNIPKNRKGKKGKRRKFMSRRQVEEMYADRFKDRVRELFS